MRLQIISKLAYSWTGWPRDGAVPECLPAEFLDQLQQIWQSDGLSYIDSRWSGKQWQITFQSTPSVRPIDITRKSKGRIVHALQQTGYRNCFKRKVSLRSLGDNCTATVLKYVATQLDRSDLADPRYINQLNSLKYSNDRISLSEAQIVAHGRYWINMHVVLVIAERYRIRESILLDNIRKTILRWGLEDLNHASKETHFPGIKSLSIMPDHMHIVIRAPIDRSPQFLLERLWQKLNQAAGFLLCSDELYVGTFSDYSVRAIRRVNW